MPPTEKAFLRQADVVREALETFLAVVEKGSPRVTFCSMTEVVNYTVRLPFLSTLRYVLTPYQAGLSGITEFIAHPVFQELPLAVYKAVEDYSRRNPSVKLPDTWNQVLGLRARINDYLRRPPAKKGMFSTPFLSHFHLITR